MGGCGLEDWVGDARSGAELRRGGEGGAREGVIPMGRGGGAGRDGVTLRADAALTAMCFS